MQYLSKRGTRFSLKAAFSSLTKQQKFSFACAAVSFSAISVFSLFLGARLFDIIRDPRAFKAYLTSYGKEYSEIIFVGLRSLQTVVKIIPGEPLELGAGFAFGIFGGFALCMLGTAIGSAVIVLLTKTFGLRLVELFISEEKLRSLPFLKSSDRTYFLLFIIYLIPGTPKDLLTYAAAFTDMDLIKFFLITGFARIPSIITSTVCGASLLERDYRTAAIVYAATLLLSAIGVAIYRKVSVKKTA